MTDEAGWRADPGGRHEMRYWDGVRWTDNVSDGGVTSTDPYDAKAVPPPPTKVQTAAAAVTYRLVCYDRRGRELYAAPYQSADLAMQFATANQSFRVKHSVGSALLKGAMRPNIVEWRDAVIYRVNEATGEESEYHRMRR